MSFMTAFGLASIMLCVGILLRAKISFLRNMLVPASVIGGIIGIIFMNVVSEVAINIGTDADMFTNIVNNLFTISFISITLSNEHKGEEDNAKGIIKGATALGLVWCVLYAILVWMPYMACLFSSHFVRDQGSRQHMVLFLNSMDGVMPLQ